MSNDFTASIVIDLLEKNEKYRKCLNWLPNNILFCCLTGSKQELEPKNIILVVMKLKKYAICD
ncbi:hypothetical protein ACOSQ3_022282 [Xanthoceras sorbifolium]